MTTPMRDARVAAQQRVAANRAERMRKIAAYPALVEGLKVADKWFGAFGYNAWGIALSDDHPDYQQVWAHVRAALKEAGEL